MHLYNYLKKPELYFRPASIINRLFGSQKTTVIRTTPWKSQIEINPHETIGKAIYNTGIYDLAVSEILWRLIEPGNFVLDIGANIGYTATICSYKADIAGKVWIFEPNPMLLSRITRNIQYNRHQNITFFSIALSDSNQEGFLVLPEDYGNNEGVAFIGSKETGKTIKVDLKKLDDLLPNDNPVNVLKIDVEGHELEVLKGAKNSLTKGLIKNIVFEDHNGYPSDVANFLLNAGYEIFRIEKGWFSVKLKDPYSTSKICFWEPHNYLATLDREFVKKKMKGSFYKCLGY